MCWLTTWRKTAYTHGKKILIDRALSSRMHFQRMHIFFEWPSSFLRGQFWCVNQMVSGKKEENESPFWARLEEFGKTFFSLLEKDAMSSIKEWISQLPVFPSLPSLERRLQNNFLRRKQDIREKQCGNRLRFFKHLNISWKSPFPSHVWGLFSCPPLRFFSVSHEELVTLTRHFQFMPISFSEEEEEEEVRSTLDRDMSKIRDCNQFFSSLLPKERISRVLNTQLINQGLSIFQKWRSVLVSDAIFQDSADALL